MIIALLVLLACLVALFLSVFRRINALTAQLKEAERQLALYARNARFDIEVLPQGNPVEELISRANGNSYLRGVHSGNTELDRHRPTENAVAFTSGDKFILPRNPNEPNNVLESHD
jgi:hypothetical protein